MQPVVSQTRGVGSSRVAPSAAARRAPPAAALPVYAGMRRATAVDLVGPSSRASGSLRTAAAVSCRRAGGAGARRLATTAMFEVRPSRRAGAAASPRPRMLRWRAHAPRRAARAPLRQPP